VAAIDDRERRVAAIIDKVLRGANPGDIPIEQPTRLTVGINMKAAKALGIDMPQSVVMRADEVIR
jgi:putative ABC transport system substrate-binding protein